LQKRTTKSSRYLRPSSGRFLKNGRNALFAVKIDAAGRADCHAGRTFFIRQPVDAEIALDCNLLTGIELHGAERTGFQTFTTPDTKIIIY
jgi:hypothetical protein